MRIGIFDSGIGGLNVLKELVKKYPNNHYIYYGDTKNVPYGNKSLKELLELSSNIIDYLILKDVDMIIIACGTISSNCYKILKDKYDIKLYDIISPTISYINESNYQNIGLIATNRTIESKIFINNSSKIVLDKSTPSFVQMIENNKVEIKNIKDSLSIFKGKIDALILGCTHYPCLEKKIGDYLNVPLIDMGKCLSEKIKLENKNELKIEMYFSLMNNIIKKNIDRIIPYPYVFLNK